MRKIKIGIDVEGVLADIHTLFLEEISKFYQIDAKLEEITDWEWEILTEKLKEKCIDVGNLYMKWSSEYWKKRWKEIPLIEKDSPSILKELRKTSKIYIVTHRKNIESVKKWLDYQGFEHDGLIYVQYGVSKLEAVDVCLLVDDNPTLSTSANYRKKLLLYDRPWNREVKENDWIKRIYSLKEIQNFIPPPL
jgi:5'(3')-deoxyribonucleotidase